MHVALIFVLVFFLFHHPMICQSLERTVFLLVSLTPSLYC